MFSCRAKVSLIGNAEKISVHLEVVRGTVSRRIGEGTLNMSNQVFSRPDELFPVQEKEPVSGTCSECGEESLCRYPVLSEGGWFLVVKCQKCLHCAERDRWNRLGHIVLATDALRGMRKGD